MAYSRRKKKRKARQGRQSAAFEGNAPGESAADGEPPRRGVEEQPTSVSPTSVTRSVWLRRPRITGLSVVLFAALATLVSTTDATLASLGLLIGLISMVGVFSPKVPLSASSTGRRLTNRECSHSCLGFGS